MEMKVSLATVVYNEANRIDAFLDAVASHVDEIVIVDQSSTDGTIDAVSSWGERNLSLYGVESLNVVLDKHWGFCERSRALAHSRTSGDWVLVLDADERISTNTAKFVRALRSNHPSIGETLGVNLKRSLWVSGIHYWTGDYQFRLFNRAYVKYLDELHTEPQSTIKDPLKVYSPDWVGIWHEKSWVEQIRDENAYSKLITSNDPRRDAKLALNVYSRMLEDAGLTPEEADKLAHDGADLAAWGIAPEHEPHEEIE
jgi:glycosyltransferase involved in cell wall biosynthesis